jgi:nucleoside-diphosphate-sugar epimerase
VTGSAGYIGSHLVDALLARGFGVIGIDNLSMGSRENFADAMKEKGIKAGVLQFGAGHKDGLIKELNKRGISVIVITPLELAK